jgi:ubiquitin-conjugating enzyme (huntingtin interacting protein 2)
MAAANGRLLKELKEVAKDDTSGIKAAPVTVGNLRHLKGSIPGPGGTPYEGGVFEIDIVIPKQYPFEPPKMKYMTKIWHPNISSQTGAICLVCTCVPDVRRVPSSPYYFVSLFYAHQQRIGILI